MKSQLTKLGLTLLIIITCYLIYFFPIQKYYAEKNIAKYIELQGISTDNIESKETFKNYKSGGYSIYVHYKDEPNYTYLYDYYPNKKELIDKVELIVFDQENVEVSIKNLKIKYPALNNID